MKESKKAQKYGHVNEKNICNEETSEKCLLTQTFYIQIFYKDIY